MKGVVYLSYLKVRSTLFSLNGAEKRDENNESTKGIRSNNRSLTCKI